MKHMACSKTLFHFCGTFRIATYVFTCNYNLSKFIHGYWVRQQAPQIPWRNIARMRDTLIHHYFGVNLDIVWQVLQNDLAPLLSAIQDILASKNGTNSPHKEPEEQNTES